MTLLEEDYLNKIAALDAEIAKLQAQSRQLFYEYLQYLKRLKDPQTDLDDFIREKELKNKQFPA